MIDLTDNSHKSRHCESKAEKGTINGFIAQLFSNTFLHIAILLAIVFGCFGRTLTSYFLADDFGEVGYVSTIFSGKWELFWSSLTGNYMQVPGMSVYRPFLLISLMIDWLIYHASAFGYYLTNLLYFAGCVCLSYLVFKQITREWGPVRASLASLSGAALFALSPLRCESVSWVVGRVDIICCFFYLASIFLFLNRTRFRFATVFGVACMWLALLTKEMAVGLPVVLAGLSILQVGANPRDEADPASAQKKKFFSLPPELQVRFKVPLQALADTQVFWLSLLIYFVIRQLCLGTLGGGYVAGFGAAQISHMVQRWLDPDTVHRIFFPFNAAVAPEPNIYSRLLAWSYGGLGAVALLRIGCGSLPLRLWVFVFVWAATVVAPIYQLWGLGYDLEGSRFYFFLGVPLSFFLATLVFAPFSAKSDMTSIDTTDEAVRNGNNAALMRRINSVGTAIGATAVVLLIGTSGRVTAMTNAAWVNAGKGVHHFIQRCRELCGNPNFTSRIGLLGIPKERAGAHQILNGLTFDCAIEPPFTSTKLSQRLWNFDPVMFSPAEFINSTRFKRIATQAPILLWDGRYFLGISTPAHQTAHEKGNSMIDVLPRKGEATMPGNMDVCAQTVGHLQLQTENDSLILEDCHRDDGVRFNKLNLSPMDFDYLEFEMRCTGGPARRKIKIAWDAPSVLPINPILAEGASIDGIETCAWEQIDTPSTVSIHKKSARRERDTDRNEKEGDLPSSDHPELWPVAQQAESKSPADILSTQKYQTVRVHLSQFWRWFVNREIRELTLYPDASDYMQIRNVRLLKAQAVAPSVVAPRMQENGSGVIYLKDQSLELSFDGREVPGVASVEIQVSKPDFFFDNFYEADGEPAAGSSMLSRQNPGHLDLKGTQFQLLFPTPAYYQIRARCRDKHGQPVGEYSDAITISTAPHD